MSSSVLICLLFCSIYIIRGLDIDWCIVTPASHIRYYESCSNFANYSSSNISWSACKGEYENYQLILEKSSVNTNFSFTVSEFINSNDNSVKLPSSLITVYQIGHVNCSQTTRYAGSGGGFRPDPLFKLSSDTYGTSLPLGSKYAQLIWITVGQIPYDSVSGIYSSKISISFSNNEISSITVPIELEIWNISIPTTLQSSFSTVFAFSENVLSQYYKQPQYNLTQMKYQYFDFLTSYRIPPDALYQNSTRSIQDYKYLIQNTKWSNLEDVQSAIGGGCSFNQQQINSVISKLNDTVMELQENNMDLSNFYVYGFDEEPTSCKNAIISLFGSIQKQWPDIRTTATLNWKDINLMLDLPLNAWDLQYEFFNQTATSIWRNSSNSYSNNDKRDMWLYHCIEPSGINYLNTFIERPLMQARILFWLGASYIDVNGWLYYAVDLWKGCPSQGIPNKNIINRYNATLPFTDFNPANYIWCPRTDIFANGDGYFLYPGLYGPVTTSRLQNIRDGLEDLELFRMIKDVKTMQSLIHQIVTGPTTYSLDPVLMQKVRKQAAQYVLNQ